MRFLRQATSTVRTDKPPRWAVIGVLLLTWFAGARGHLHAALNLEGSDIPQFDVFVGFDGTTVEGNWAPVVCEIRNEGPTFTATFEFSESMQQGEFVRRMPLELPTGTLKRFNFPMYSASRFETSYRAVLRDQQGRVLVEYSKLSPSSHLTWNSILLGAVPASAPGMPTFPRVDRRSTANQPVAEVARFQPEMLPDNPLALGGLDALYLNSQRAVDLEANQVQALMSWLHGGGHLIVGVDAVIDVNGVPWLNALMPGPLGSLRTVRVGNSLTRWVHSGTDGSRSGRSEPITYPGLPDDPAFEAANIRAVEINAPDADVLVESNGLPLMVSTPRERGRLTVLLFNPELAPVRSWELRPWFWARLAEVPAALLTNDQPYSSGGTSVEGVFGAIVDSTQIRKLPVSALLLLLVVYLVVIGPLDQWWLKKINRQMLTWITFPCYVVLFSVLIYYIGYRLRAGDSEWNELQVVDIIPKGRAAELHGITYASIYSPVNNTYDISAKEPVAALRQEASGSRGFTGGGQAAIRMNGYAYTARVTVPVWTSQTFVNSWQTDADPGFTAEIRRSEGTLELALNNRSLPAGSRARVFIDERVHDLTFPGPGQSNTQIIPDHGGVPIREFATEAGRFFGSAIAQRQQALGQDEARFRIDAADASMAISVGRYLGENYNQFNQASGTFMFPGGLDLSSQLDRHQALLLVYCENHAPTEALNDFQPIRSKRDTLLRLSVALPD